MQNRKAVLHNNFQKNSLISPPLVASPLYFLKFRFLQITHYYFICYKHIYLRKFILGKMLNNFYIKIDAKTFEDKVFYIL